MNKDNDIKASNESSSTTNSQTLVASIPPLPPSTLGKRKLITIASNVWKHFIKIENSDPKDPRCKCNIVGGIMHVTPRGVGQLL